MYGVFSYRGTSRSAVHIPFFNISFPLSPSDTLEALNVHPEGAPASLPRDSEGQTALHLAAIRGDLDRVHWKDAEGKRFVSYHCDGFFDENRRCARTLLSSRRLLAENADGWTPLEVALQKRNLDCAHAIFCVSVLGLILFLRILKANVLRSF